MKHLRRNLAILSCIFGLVACNFQKKTSLFPESSDWYGLAMPQWLTSDTTVLFAADYFYKDGQFDSLIPFGGIKINYHPDSTHFKVIRSTKDQHLFGLNFYQSGFVYQLVLKNRPKYEQLFSFQGTAQTQNVAVKGDFNGWNAGSSPMHRDANHLFSTRVKMAPGEYGYQLVVDGKSILDPSNPSSKSNGMGGMNSLLRANLPEPGLKLTTNRFDQESIILEMSGQATQIMVLWDNHPLSFEKTNGSTINIKIPKEAKHIKRSFIRAFAGNQYGHSNDVLIPLEHGIPLTDVKLTDRSDLERTVMYFVMIDRFLDGDATNNHPLKDPTVLPKANYHGGDLQGILSQLKNGYFNDLGVNALWISPISQNPMDAWGQFRDPDTRFSGYHGYWPVSSSQVDFRFGNEAVLRELLSEAHKRGINVYLDYVANHVHKSHPVYQKHPDWATSLYLPDGTMNTERWDDHRLTTWFDTFLPTLDLENHRVADYMSDSALFWMENFEFDGFRHDATKHIPESFWRIVTRKMKAKAASKNIRRFYQIGETYGNPELISGYLGNGLLDAQFDFNLYDAMLPAFAYGETSFGALKTEQTRSINYYGNHHLMGNITGNQDKPRFISYADEQLPRNIAGNEFKRLGWKDAVKGVHHDTAYKRMALMQTYLLTIPGIPVIYYGDEFGMPGAGDPDNRRMMKFDQLSPEEMALKKHVKQLTALRSKNPCLVYGDFNFEQGSDQVMIYTRRYFDEIAVVCVNKSDQPQKTKLTLPAGFNRVKETVIALGASITFTKNQIELTVPAHASSVYIVVKNKK